MKCAHHAFPIGQVQGDGNMGDVRLAAVSGRICPTNYANFGEGKQLRENTTLTLLLSGEDRTLTTTRVKDYLDAIQMARI